MIRVTLQGRLGNWMFQYAVGRALALRLGTELVLDLTERRRFADPLAMRVRRPQRHFALRARFELRPLFSHATPTYRETSWAFDPAVLTLRDGAWLEGFFQSPHYFEDHADTLRAELTPRIDSVRRRVPGLEGTIASTNSVAVHVRRTDYLQKANRHLCTTAYYERATGLLRERLDSPRFFIFSDDLKWCREHLAAADTTFADTSAAPREIYDLALMSRCRHHVIANSTFSWWGAWLAQAEDQLVLAPDRWVLEPEPSALAMRDTLPQEWLRMET